MLGNMRARAANHCSGKLLRISLGFHKLLQRDFPLLFDHSYFCARLALRSVPRALDGFAQFRELRSGVVKAPPTTLRVVEKIMKNIAATVYLKSAIARFGCLLPAWSSQAIDADIHVSKRAPGTQYMFSKVPPPASGSL